MRILSTNFTYQYPLHELDKDKVVYLILHHAAAVKASAEDIHRWHQQKGFGGFGYNEYIRKDGSVYIGRGKYQGAHCKNYNAVSYGICVEGNYDVETQMPSVQKEVLKARIENVFLEYPNVQAVYRHSDFRATACPGRYFPFEEFCKKAVIDPSENERVQAIERLVQKKILTDPNYWIHRAKPGETVRGEYVEILIRKIAKHIL